MDKLELLKISVGAGIALEAVLLAYEVLCSVRFARECWGRHVKRLAGNGYYPVPGNYREYIYGRRSGRCVGSKKMKKRIIRNAKKRK